MKRVVFIVLVLVSCAGPKVDIYQHITPAIDIKNAVAIASAFLDSTCCKNQYIRDSVRVWEWAADINMWNVEFRKIANEKPSSFVVQIDKQHGEPRLQLQK